MLYYLQNMATIEIRGKIISKLMRVNKDVIVAYHNKEFGPQIEYVVTFLLSIYGITWRILDYDELRSLELRLSNLLISYGKYKPKLIYKHHIHLYESEFFGKKHLKSESLPETPLKKFGELPVIYYGCGDFDGFVRRSENFIETNIDIIASSFFMLSRYEEAVLDKRDKFDRFPATESLAYKENFLSRPIINEYIELLWKWIDSFRLGFKRGKLWGDKDFAICLTHDVDNIRKYGIFPPIRTIGSFLLGHRDLRKAFATTVDYLRAKAGRDPYSNFNYIMDLEDKHRLKSSFYFIAGGKTKYERRYSMDDLYVNSLIRILQERGFEIGIHASFDSYNNLRLLNLEKEELERVMEGNVLGGRQHYLRWRIPETWKIWGKAGLKYDTTLSFAEHEGFRGGICFPYKPFDVLENRILDIWELPLTVMDTSLFVYQNLTPEEGFQRIKSLIDTTKKYNGLFVLPWHNSSLDDLKLPGWIEVYEKTMEYLGTHNVFSDTARGIIDWWEKRGLVYRDK